MSSDRMIRAAYAYLYIGDFQEAKAAFERAAKENPDNPEPLFLASITAHRSRLYDEAEHFIRQALEIRPTSKTYQTHLALVVASSYIALAKEAYFDGDTAAALQDCVKALEADPLNEDARQFMEDLTQAIDIQVLNIEVNQHDGT